MLPTLVRSATYPAQSVSWRFASPVNDQSVAILIPDSAPTAFKVLACNLEASPVRAAMTGWNIDPDQWEVTQGIDTNEDDTADAPLSTREETFERSRSIEITPPSHSTTVLTLRLKTPGTPFYRSWPDLGLDPEDITVAEGQLRARVHGLGAVASPTATLAFRGGEGRMIATTTVPPLRPQITDVLVPLPVGSTIDGGTVEIDPDHRLGEITPQQPRPHPFNSTPMITSMNHHPIPLFSLRTCLTAWAALLLGASVLSASEVWRLDRTDNTGEHAIQMIGSPQVVTEGGVKAVAFDGARDGLLVPVNPLAGLDAFTIEVLLAPAAGGLAEQRVVHIQDGSSIDTRVMLETRLTPEGKWCVDTALLAGENKCVLIDRTKLHPSRQWAWVALRYDGKTMAHFVDGVKEMEGSVAFPRMKPGQTSLGVRQNLVSWYKGEIREVRFHPAALADGKLARVGSASAAAAEAKPPKPNMGGQPQTRTPH